MTTIERQYLDPRNYVDREDHQAHLQRMICGEVDTRALLISDESGQGKSDLLLRLRLNCVEQEPRAAVLLLDVRELAAPFAALERSRVEPSNLDAFDDLRSCRRTYEDWERTGRLEIDGGGGHMTLNAANAHVSGNGELVGQKILVAPAGIDSPSAQHRIVAAFLNDLKSQRAQHLVILVDHYNKAETPLQRWLDEKLLRPCLSGELSGVVIVFASTPTARPSYAAELDTYLAVMPLTRLHDSRDFVRSLVVAHDLHTQTGQDLEKLTDMAMLCFDLKRSISISDVIGLLGRFRRHGDD